MTVYFIGGSPCSGKSTVAQALSEKYHLRYFKVDEYLEKYMKMAAADGKGSCKAVEQMTPEQIWMREPIVQCDEEIQIYEEIFPYILADLEKTECDHGIITEGAAYLPSLMKACAVPANRYISITPSKEFQVSHYRQREWVPYVLEGCSDKEKAFENWMERDALFAKAVQQQCTHHRYLSLINNGAISVEEMMGSIAMHFKLQG